MKIVIDIPKEFETHFKIDRFEDSLHRLSADAHSIAGNYENEVAELLIDAFRNCTPLPKGHVINWKEEFISLVRSIGCVTFGKERWFLQDNGLWYDRLDIKEITIDELHIRIYEEILGGNDE